VHVVAEFSMDGGGNRWIYAYVNGQLAAQNGGAYNTTLSWTTLHLGCINSGAPYYQGLLQDFRIYNRLLSAYEIQCLYQAGSEGVPGSIGPQGNQGSQGSVAPVSTYSVTTSTYADPGGNDAYLINNYGAATITAPSGSIIGTQRVYVNGVGINSVLTIQMASGNTVALNGANGSSGGTLVSGGALGDAIGLICDATNHWTAFVIQGGWSKT
jgi:hypothetical protein